MSKYYVDLSRIDSHTDSNGLHWDEGCVVTSTFESVLHKSVKGVGELIEVFVRGSGGSRIITGVFSVDGELPEELMGCYLLVGFHGVIEENKVVNIEDVFVDDFVNNHSDSGLKGFRHELS